MNRPGALVAALAALAVVSSTPRPAPAGFTTTLAQLEPTAVGGAPGFAAGGAAARPGAQPLADALDARPSLALPPT
ncbi:MAG: hypothetical protein K2V38_00730, partial [Gemmataceae bacterium]|nr:hypothetical protein [Gemmataceae bacterium]